MSTPRNYIRSAMFVDFDNIFITYASEDEALAKEFATKPEKWLEWIGKRMPAAHVGDITERKVLIRRCYMNPVVFAQYRPFFTRAGFEVIDCPPLTTRGKTSTDIHMVIDTMDTLEHSTHFDEFVILSGDADFTPVLLRLRKHDRSTVVLAAGYVSPAYKAAADFVIDQDTFVREAIGYVEPESEVPITPAESTQNTQLAPFMEKITNRLEEVIRESGPIQAINLSKYYREVTTFSRQSNWLGCGSLRRLTEVIVAHQGRLVITKEDPWRVGLPEEKACMAAASSSLEPDITEETPADEQGILRDVQKTILGFISASKYTVSMPKMAGVLNKKFGPAMIDSAWLGKGSFTNLLKALDLGDIRLTDENPAHMYIPEIHQQEVDGRLSGAALHDDLPSKINKITDVPLLTTKDYSVLFRELYREIKGNDFTFNRTSKNVRDRCVEDGYSISRNSVNLVVNGLLHVGARLKADRVLSARDFAEKYYENVLALCANAQLPLSDEDKKEVLNWIVGETKP